MTLKKTERETERRVFKRFVEALILFLLFWVAVGSFTVFTAYSFEGVPQRWQVGNLAVYLFSFPYMNVDVVNNTVVESPTTIRGSVSVTLAVWGASQEEPVRVMLDGQPLTVITEEGYYTVSTGETSLGSHHIAVQCDYQVFEEATFVQLPPLPQPTTIALTEFLNKLSAQKEQVVTHMILSVAAAIPFAIATKKKTKVRTDYVLLIPAVLGYVGYMNMDTQYVLVSFSVAYALTYVLAREYAEWLGVLSISKDGIQTRLYPTDDEGNVIRGIGLTHWRRGFINRKRIELKDPYPILFEFKGERFKTVIAKEVQETPEALTVTCHNALSQALVVTKIVEELQDKLAKSDTRRLLYQRAMKSAVIWTLHKIEEKIRKSPLDKMARLEDYFEKPEEIAKEVEKDLFDAPRKTMQKVRTKGEDDDAEEEE